MKVFALARSLRLALFVGAICWATPAAAQFIQTDLNTYQLPDPKKQVVIVATEIGLFIAYAPDRSTPLSGFDVQQLTTDNSASVFLAYGSRAFIPEKIVLPGTKNEFRVRGTMTVLLGRSVRLSVAMIADHVPYITVVSSEKDHEAIIGFVGRQVVLNLRGPAAVELFDADQVWRQYGDVAPPYEIRSDNKLYLEGKLVTAESAVGLFTQPDNPCLQQKHPVIWEKDYTRISEAMKTDPALTPKRALKRTKDKLKLAAFLPLTVSNTSIVGIHYDTSRFAGIREESLGAEKVCVAKVLTFSN